MMQDLTKGWKTLGVIAEGEPLLIEGLNPWSNTWHSVDYKRITVAHPCHLTQRHHAFVYELHASGKVITFAAGELSAGAWGFYVPE